MSCENDLPLANNTGCSCRQKPILQVVHVLWALSKVFVLCFALSIFFAYAWSFVDWLRNYGTAPLLLPFMAGTEWKPVLDGKAYGEFDKLVDLYNCSFPGFGRFGSGIGLIAGAFWSFSFIDSRCWIQRLTFGISAGAIAGSRLFLMFSSDWHMFLFGLSLGALLAVTYVMFFWNRFFVVPDLPLVNLESGEAFESC